MTEKTERQKRRTPESLQKVLTVDKAVTKKFCSIVEKFLPLPKYRKYYKFLEYTCHALPWFFGSIAALWLLWNEDLFQTQVNLMFGILISMVLHWCAQKLFEDRPPRINRFGRMCCPLVNPSECATVATYVASFFCYLQPLYAPMRLFFKIWVAVICGTRISSGKHRILDVIIGIFLGYLSGLLLHHMWLDRDTCRFILTLEVKRALFLDCLVVAVTKAFVRRRRPAANNNDMFLAVGVDAYSFPSGHVSRAVMVTYFTACILHSNFLLVLLCFIWAICVSVSRVLMKRHHILDVIGGVIVGLAEGHLVSLLWLSRSTSIWLVNYLSSEAVDLEGLQDGDGLETDID